MAPGRAPQCCSRVPWMRSGSVRRPAMLDLLLRVQALDTRIESALIRTTRGCAWAWASLSASTTKKPSSLGLSTVSDAMIVDMNGWIVAALLSLNWLAVCKLRRLKNCRCLLYVRRRRFGCPANAARPAAAKHAPSSMRDIRCIKPVTCRTLIYTENVHAHPPAPA